MIEASTYRALLDEELRAGLDALADPPALPPLSSAGRAIPTTSLPEATRALHRAALDADAIVIVAMGLPLAEAVRWAHACVRELAETSPDATPEEAILCAVGEWAEDFDGDVLARLERLAGEVETASPCRWLARALIRGVLASDHDSLEARLAARYAVLSAVGLAAASADATRHGSYRDRLARCVALAPCITEAS